MTGKPRSPFQIWVCVGHNRALAGVKLTKMQAVPFFAENTRPLSKGYLVGIAVGGYVAIAVAVFCIGGGLFFFNAPPPGNLQAFLLLIPAFYIGFFDFIQMHAVEYFHHQPSQFRFRSMNFTVDA